MIADTLAFVQCIGREFLITWLTMLDLRSLTYLVTLARRANYARAADELGISQPALTRAIQSLERQLGMRLFDRDRSGATPTPQGADFIERASALVANARDLERQSVLTAKGSLGRVRFGMAPMPARALLAPALIQQIALAPNLTNEVVVRNVEALWPMLIAGEVEFFVSAEGQVPPAPPVRAEVLGTFPQGLIARARHPLTSGHSEDITFPVLISSGFGFQPPGPWSKHLSMPPHVVEEFETLAEVTAATDAVWICSPFAVRSELLNGILVNLLHDDPAPDMRIMMYSLNRRTQSPAARALKDIFRDGIRELRSG